MTEPDQVEFHELVGAPDGRQPAGSPSPSVPVRIGIVAGSAILFVIGAVAAMGASPAPSGAAASPDAGTTTPANPVAPGLSFDGMMPKVGIMGGPGTDLRGGFRLGFRDITITAIDGSNLSLKTDDGWTRTIAVGSSTTITKGGQTIALGDLAIGDKVVFGETKASDGSYTIDQIRVVLPVVGGQVTAVGTDSITVDQKGGGSATIHVSSSTTYDVNGTTGAKLSDVTVGSFVVAEGTQRSDGSLDASAVHAGTPGEHGRGGGMGPMFRGGPWDNDQDHSQAAPSATPSTSSSAS
ncbi:MAG: hypothetical protein HY262_14370 [Chloroflexi bacterium]|nr:hypothetical protein [Chloroflexota bacterium]